MVKKKTKDKSAGSRGKVKGPVRVAVRRAVSESAPAGEGPVDLVEVRENIRRLGGHSAIEMVTNAIAMAKNGQIAPMKFLFEVVGLYPVVEEPKGPEESIAYGLLKRIGMAKEAAIQNEISQGQESAEKSEV